LSNAPLLMPMFLLRHKANLSENIIYSLQRKDPLTTPGDRENKQLKIRFNDYENADNKESAMNSKYDRNYRFGKLSESDSNQSWRSMNDRNYAVRGRKEYNKNRYGQRSNYRHDNG